MKSKMIYSLLVISALFSSPLALSAESAPATAQQQKIQKNGEVIGWIGAIDEFEVKASEIAVGKNVDEKVKEFAQMLNSEHSKNLDELDKLSADIDIQPVESEALVSFKKDGAETLTKLSDQDEGFQKLFIDTMVTGHAGALKKVNTDLMKKATNPKLKTFLKATRDMIAHHLEEAKAIQKSMKKSG